MKTGLGFCGSVDHLRAYMEAVRSVESLPVIAWCDQEEGVGPFSSSMRRYSRPDELLADDTILGVINCTPLGERVFWCERALEAGKSVLSPSPIGERYKDVHRLIRQNQRGQGGDVIIASPAYYGEVGRAVTAGNGLGNLLFFDWEVRISRKRIATQKYGVLLLGGVDPLSLVERQWGPVDTIWAQSRSLGTNRPAEDISQIYIKCKNGKEGSMHINGLGDKSEERLHLFGRRGSRQISASGEGGAEAWRGAYLDFIDRLAGRGKNGFDGEMARDGFRLMHWVQQAARLNRELDKGEVKDGE